MAILGSWTVRQIVSTSTSRRAAEATDAYRQAEKLLLPLVDRHPTGHESLVLAAMYVNWGLLHQKPGEFPQALARHTRAVEMVEAVLQKEPQHNTARIRAFNAHGARAQDLEALGRWSEAAGDWERVVALDGGPDRWVRRVFLAQSLARAGEHARAAAEAESVAEMPRVTADGRWELARTFALAIPAVRADTKLTVGERGTLVERNAAAAVDLLKRLQDDGFFKDPAHARWLNTDRDWQPLHELPGFQKLLLTVMPGK